jgi:hypothetical protein
MIAHIFSKFNVFIISVGILTSCSSPLESPFYRSEEVTVGQKEIIESEFGKDAEYQIITLFYNPLTGNFINVSMRRVPGQGMLENWNYSHTPVKTGRSYRRFKIGSVAMWEKTSEKFPDNRNLLFFKVSDIPWTQIPAWFASVSKDMVKRGSERPEVDMISFQKNSNEGLVAYINAETEGGGSSLRYTLNMEGKLVREPE